MISFCLKVMPTLIADRVVHMFWRPIGVVSRTQNRDRDLEVQACAAVNVPSMSNDLEDAAYTPSQQFDA